MSFLDSFAHEYVGHLAGYPISHPLENIDGEFWATPHHLVLGEGSGGHPAVTVSIQAAVVDYLFYLLEQGLDDNALAEFFDEVPAFKQLGEEIRECLWFHHWQIADYAQFFTRCTNEALLEDPFDADNDDSPIEHWLLRNIGKLVCLSLPDLAPELEGSLSKVWSVAKRFVDSTCNVEFPPIGFPVPGGRAPGGPIGEGYSAWETRRRAKTLD